MNMYENDPFLYATGDESDDDESEGLGDILGAVATGGLSLLPRAAQALGVGQRPKTGTGGGYSSGIRGQSGAVIRTPAGSANIKFPASLVTKEELKAALDRVSADVKKNANAISETNKKLDSATVNQINGFKKIEGKLDSLRQNNMMQSMMSMMMQPDIEKITFAQDPKANQAIEVTDVDFESNYMPMIMGMMGGGDGKDSDMMMMAMMAMVMAQGKNG